MELEGPDQLGMYIRNKFRPIHYCTEENLGLNTDSKN